jgi:hypothetical protein
MDDLQTQMAAMKGQRKQPDSHFTIAKLFNELCWSVPVRSARWS